MKKSFIKAVINREYSLIKALEDLGVVPVGSLTPERTCFCPFHDNSNTKAAKIYDDPKGITLFCFAEQKSFRSSDAIEKFSNESLEDVFKRIWSKLSKEEQTNYLDEYESGDDNLSPEWSEVLDKIKGFKKGTMSYDDVLNIILNTAEAEHNGNKH